MGVRAAAAFGGRCDDARMARGSEMNGPARAAGAREPAARARIVALAAAGIALLLATAVARPAPQELLRYDGEFGLWVEARRDSVVVRWLTREAQAGRLEVEAGGRALVTLDTPDGSAHRAAFATPREREVLLRYGGTTSDTLRFETLISLAPPRRAPTIQSAVDTVYVIGDTHGMYDEFVEGMQRVGLIDGALRWNGGRRHLVLAGDLLDRGPDVLALVWLVYRLEREAAAAGGRVHTVLGNHEIMVMKGDLRYVHPKEAEIARWHDASYDALFDIDVSILGRWLAAKPAALRIGDAVIVHGGLHPYYAQHGLRALDDTLRTFMGEELFRIWSDTTIPIRMDSASFARREHFFWAPESLFWHRGYVQSDTLGAELTEALRAVGARTLVVGHTPVDSIHTRYDGRLVAAHTPRFGAELVRLVRTRDGYRAERVTAAGTEPID
jgi:hypothetical protein